MGGACSVHGGDKKCVQNFGLKEYLKIILKCNIRKKRLKYVDWIDRLCEGIFF